MVSIITWSSSTPSTTGHRPVVDVEMGHRSDSVCSPFNIGYQLGYSDPDIYAVGIRAL